MKKALFVALLAMSGISVAVAYDPAGTHDTFPERSVDPVKGTIGMICVDLQGFTFSSLETKDQGRGYEGCIREVIQKIRAKQNEEGPQGVVQPLDPAAHVKGYKFFQQFMREF